MRVVDRQSPVVCVGADLALELIQAEGIVIPFCIPGLARLPFCLIAIGNTLNESHVSSKTSSEGMAG